MDEIKQTAFNEDGFILKEVNKLKEQFNVHTFIETGTYFGQTTKVMAGLFEKVYSCESNVKYFDTAVNNIGSCTNIFLHKQVSVDFFHTILPELKEKALFFLDAHWQRHNPLLDELTLIANYKINNPIILIHDFQVPNTDFGFDFYDFEKKQPINWLLIKNYIEIIYNKKYHYYYNKEACGARRGICYIIPNDNKNEVRSGI